MGANNNDSNSALIMGLGGAQGGGMAAGPCVGNVQQYDRLRLVLRAAHRRLPMMPAQRHCRHGASSAACASEAPVQQLVLPGSVLVPHLRLLKANGGELHGQQWEGGACVGAGRHWHGGKHTHVRTQEQSRAA